MGERVLRLTGRYYRTMPLDQPGYEARPLALDPQRTAFVAMHCWNIGCEGGPEIDPDYFVGMGSLESFGEAARIMREFVRPAMDAARAAGILVCHVEHDAIAARHPEALADADPPPCPAGRPAVPPVVPGWREHIAARSHGRDYATRSPYARMDRAAIAAPLPGEPFVFQTAQFDRALRRRGIENLVYSGFATDMCILRAPGGVEAMAPLGYRLFLMRDATVGLECADTFEERVATRWGIRFFETHYGDTVVLADFLRACGGLR